MVTHSFVLPMADAVGLGLDVPSRDTKDEINAKGSHKSEESEEDDATLTLALEWTELVEAIAADPGDLAGSIQPKQCALLINSFSSYFIRKISPWT